MDHDRPLTQWQAFREPVRTTLVRTVGLALILGTGIAWMSRGRLSWAVSVLIALWPALGGHFVELWYLNFVRPNIAPSRGVQVAARVLTWALAGVVLLLGMRATARAFAGPQTIAVSVLIGALGFVTIELIAHLGLQLRGRPSFYNARG